MEGFVNVSVRIKPSLNEDATNSSLQVINNHPAVLLVLDRSQIFHFDNLFTVDENQEDVYNNTVKPMVENVIAGYNCTVFAYGQTGTGKTYTIGTNPDLTYHEHSGLISRSLEDFFSSIKEDNECEISISFIEIYNEKVFDLLVPHKAIPLPVKGFTVHGLKNIKIKNTFEGLMHLKSGSKNRHTGETKQNLNSSRSHAIFSIFYHSWNSEKETMAKLNLVDLAGSERAHKNGNQGFSFYEGININKGLLSLSQVMTALSTNSTHIPYRQSVITTILQDSLNKRNFVTLIACVSSNPEDLAETLQTLEFANRVKKVKNKPEVNQIITQYRRDNPNLLTNCIPRGLTPSKRSNGFVYETPFKKPKTALPMIQEPVSVNNSTIEISPLLSSSLASVTSANSQQNFSPVIKKYMNAMESSILNKLETVIKNTLKKPRRTRSSYGVNKENTPRNGIVSDFTSEIINDKTVTSSPIEQFDASGGHIRSFSSKKFLTYDDSPNASNDYKDNDSVFIVPAVPKIKNPITVRRSSVRLQMKKCMSEKRQLLEADRSRMGDNSLHVSKNEYDENDSIFVVSAVPKIKKSNVGRRSSVRLQNKKYVSMFETTTETSRRRSVRLQIKNTAAKNDSGDGGMTNKLQPNTKLENIFSPCATCRTRKIGTKNSLETNLEDSPMTLRTKQVLNILNNGTLKELEKLHTVGTKTAENIMLFRELKGKFKSISDIAEMPYWTKRKYEKFLAVNFLQC